MTRNSKPSAVHVTMYNVGFGDCFLLSFTYGKDDKRHVLIDCGSHAKTEQDLEKVVAEITKDTNGHVDAIVVTHRHKDHLSAFGLKKTGAMLAALKPTLVVQPWTEHPDAATNAESAPSLFSKNKTENRQAFNYLRTLGAMEQCAQALVEGGQYSLASFSKREQKSLLGVASLSIKNLNAVKNLATMGKRNAYVYAGSDSGLGALLPGVKVSVLGPPTLKQSKDTLKYTEKSEEYWNLQARLAAMAPGGVQTSKQADTLFPKNMIESTKGQPSLIRWLTGKADRLNRENIKGIVQAMDDVINNTSVILLFEVGSRALLFPGDAQLESWEYVFSKKDWMKRLQSTTLYKVGHHGSKNATPKTLFQQITAKGAQKPVALLSTKAGTYSGVPSTKLETALKSGTDLTSTKQWTKPTSRLKQVFEV